MRDLLVDLITIAAALCLLAAAYLISLIVGLVATGLGLGVLALALADGKGITWRRS